MMTKIDPEFAMMSKVAGALFYYRPDDYEHYGVQQLLNQSLMDQAPMDEKEKEQEKDAQDPTWNLQLNRVLTQFQENKEALTLLHDTYFAVIQGIKCPPWGSVYLDKDGILFGKSTAEYKDFLTLNGFEFETNDPLDHIGLMLMVVGELLEQNELSALQQMLGYHLLPWTSHYFSLLKQEIPQSAYSALIELTDDLLKTLQQQLAITVEPRQVFIHVG